MNKRIVFYPIWNLSKFHYLFWMNSSCRVVVFLAVFGTLSIWLDLWYRVSWISLVLPSFWHTSLALLLLFADCYCYCCSAVLLTFCLTFFEITRHDRQTPWNRIRLHDLFFKFGFTFNIIATDFILLVEHREKCFCFLKKSEKWKTPESGKSILENYFGKTTGKVKD